jgi:branched-chain amino acid transport system substrate-binding protein
MHETELVIKFLKNKRGVSRIATLFSNDGKGIEWVEWAKKHAANYGLDVVASEEMDPQPMDVTPQLTKINQTDAQAIMMSVAGTGNVIVQKNKMQLGMKQLLVTGSAYHSKRYLKLSGEAAEGCLVPGYKTSAFAMLPETDPSKGLIVKLKEQYKKDYDEDFNIFCALGWDRMKIVIEALERANPDLSDLKKARTQVRDEIEKTKNFVGGIGVHSFSPDRHSSSGLDAMIMLEVKNGEFTVAQ